MNEKREERRDIKPGDLSRYITTLLDDLASSLEMYRKVALTKESNPISGNFFQWSKRKQAYYHEIGEVMGINLEKHNLSFRQRLSLQLDKVWIEVNHLLIHLDMKELLSFCVKREEKLLASYEKVLQHAPDADHMRRPLEKQYAHSQQLLHELKRQSKEYEFLKKQ